MSETAVLMLTVGAFLAIVNLIAFLIRNSTRKTERERFESAIRERERFTEKNPDQDPFPPLLPPRDPPGSAAPAIVPARPTPHPRSLLTWEPRGSASPPALNRYITWPNTKLSTPVAERTPSDEDYVWD